MASICTTSRAALTALAAFVEDHYGREWSAAHERGLAIAPGSAADRT